MVPHLEHTRFELGVRPLSSHYLEEVMVPGSMEPHPVLLPHVSVGTVPPRAALCLGLRLQEQPWVWV